MTNGSWQSRHAPEGFFRPPIPPSEDCIRHAVPIGTETEKRSVITRGMSNDGLKTNRFKCPDPCALPASADRDLQPKWPKWETIVDR